MIRMTKLDRFVIQSRWAPYNCPHIVKRNEIGDKKYEEWYLLINYTMYVYVGPHWGTVPVLALDKKFIPVPTLGDFLPLGAPCF